LTHLTTLVVSVDPAFLFGPISRAGRQDANFSGVVAGTYAVFGFHDETSNGKMDA
jgi:hypothetical protein